MRVMLLYPAGYTDTGSRLRHCYNSSITLARWRVNLPHNGRQYYARPLTSSLHHHLVHPDARSSSRVLKLCNDNGIYPNIYKV